MGIPIMIMGKSGSGKSRSLKDFEKGEIAVFNVANKPLPFKDTGITKINISQSKQNEQGILIPISPSERYETIKSGLRSGRFNCYVIDDSQYLMGFESLDRAKEKGFDKPIEIAQKFYDLIKCIIEQTSDDTLVFLLQHTDIDDDGTIKIKSLSKMIDKQISIDGLFSVSLYATVEGSEYKFITQSEGVTTAKSPEGMFELSIENNLKFVDDAIREYWGLNPRKKTNLKPTSQKTQNK